ncbi:MAG TPA: TlpA disulfide reductase family protein [Phycisphaerales bacterium]|nr:TlpA disulfide reductase family protein [Phycisphaerales bacterium]
MRTRAWWCAVAVLAACAGGVVAQTGRTTAKPSGKPADKSVEKSAKDHAQAQALLARARDAWKNVHTLSYTAVTSAEGDEAAQQATVVCERADAGGWKIAVQVSTDNDAPLAAAGYDGVTARVVKPKDKVVVERSIETLEDLRVFFTGQGLRHVVAWDVLEDAPFGDGMRFALGPAETVEGVACDLLHVTLKDDRQTTSPADMEKGAKPDPAPTVRLFIGREDLLPRRVERIRTAGGKATTRALTLREIARDGDAEGAQFALEVPDGYRIRAGDAARTPSGRPSGQPGATAKNDAPAIEGVTWPHEPKLLAAGDKAPSFRLEDAKGAWVRLSDYKGKIVVLDFWATWCGPCVHAIPALQAVHAKYEGKPVVVLGMNCEGDPMPGKTPVDPVKFKQDKGGHYMTLLNADGVSDRYKVRGIPTFYVIDTEGKVLWGGVGMWAAPGQMSPTPEDQQKYLEQTLSAIIDAELKKLAEK